MDTYHLLATTLRTSCPRLTEFQLSDCHGTILLDVDMAALMDAGSLSGWKVLDLKAVLDQDPSQTQMDAPLGPLTIAAILRHAPTLEHIRLDNRPTFPSTAIQTLLCTAPNLRRFSTMSSLELKPHVAYLDARDIKSVDEEPWACLQLESFSCMIAHVPRQDLGYKQWERCGLNFAAEMEEDEVSRTVQRRICGQLGRLTRLRVLCLGHVAMPDPRVYFYENSSDYDEDGNYTNSRSYYNNAFAGDVYDDDDYDSSLSSDQEFDQQMTKDEQQYRSLFGNDTLQNSSLSLTLDKGLDLLADLTRLRYLDMRGMHVGIWEDEKLDWAKCFWRHRPIMRSALRGSVVKEPWKGIDPFWEEFGGWNQYE
ncbi:hypothetical protein BGW39_010658 [Mortierella sp. 14UC]|nr:hypothetical protein BGW39_010658 [Mortierella sp. 14UC]